MKKNFLKFATAFAVCATVVVTATSCDSTDESDGTVDGGDEYVYDGQWPTVSSTQSYTEITPDTYDLASLKSAASKTTNVASGESVSGTIASGEVMIIAEDAAVTLSAALHVEDGGLLVIEPGVVLTATYSETSAGYIFVEQGGKIHADGGDADGVIVMTSDNTEAGAWGGIHICGNAPINTSIPSASEIGSKNYGGTNSGDNSGTLRYVRLEYTGYSYSEDQECNGISFYGVGAGTTVEYVQAYEGSDDGFEMFGGTVNLKYCVATSCSDDSFDWTDGWVGKAQFLVAYQSADFNGKCDCLLECDNQGSNNLASPTSHPVIANATLVGNTYSDSKTDGVMLKAGTEIELFNSIITGKTDCIVIKTDNTDDQLIAGVSKLSNIYMTSGVSNLSDTPAYTTEVFDSCSNESSYSVSLTNNYVGTISGGAVSLTSTFFDDVDYAGAVPSGSDWTTGWTK